MQIFRQLVNKTKREKEDSFKGGGGEFSQDDSRGEQKFQKAVALQRELKVRRTDWVERKQRCSTESGKQVQEQKFSGQEL